MAVLRVRRGMSQQVLADRIGKSKSWVDKVERGVRTLDRLSVIETVARALGVTPNVLLAQRTRAEPVTDLAPDMESVRAALARHDPPETDHPSLRQLHDQVGYAWTAYRNGHHPQVLRALPGLLAGIRHPGHPQDPDAPTADVRVRILG
ncbi:helix-turn-helix domain-containing protein, partial [Micromonospora echinofusca]